MEDPLTNQATSEATTGEPRHKSPTGEYRGSPLLRQLVNILLGRQSIQRPALARETNLSLQLIADLLAELERRGLVLVNGRFTGIPGRSNLSYALAAGAAAALAIRVCDRWIETSLCDLRGATLANERTPLQQGAGPTVADQVGTAVRRVCEAAGLARFRLGAIHVEFAAGDASQAAEVKAELVAQIGCFVRVAPDSGRSQSDRLEAAHSDLLGGLFGETGA